MLASRAGPRRPAIGKRPEVAGKAEQVLGARSDRCEAPARRFRRCRASPSPRRCRTGRRPGSPSSPSPRPGWSAGSRPAGRRSRGRAEVVADRAGRPEQAADLGLAKADRLAGRTRGGDLAERQMIVRHVRGEEVGARRLQRLARERRQRTQHLHAVERRGAQAAGREPRRERRRVPRMMSGEPSRTARPARPRPRPSAAARSPAGSSPASRSSRRCRSSPAARRSRRGSNGAAARRSRPSFGRGRHADAADELLEFAAARVRQRRPRRADAHRAAGAEGPAHDLAEGGARGIVERLRRSPPSARCRRCRAARPGTAARAPPRPKR